MECHRCNTSALNRSKPGLWNTLTVGLTHVLPLVGNHAGVCFGAWARRKVVVIKLLCLCVHTRGLAAPEWIQTYQLLHISVEFRRISSCFYPERKIAQLTYRLSFLSVQSDLWLVLLKVGWNKQRVTPWQSPFLSLIQQKWLRFFNPFIK